MSFATCLQNPSNLCVELCGCCFSLSSIVTATAHPSLHVESRYLKVFPAVETAESIFVSNCFFAKKSPVTTLAYCLPEATEDKLPHGFGCSGGPHGAAMIFVHICSTCVQLCFDLLVRIGSDWVRMSLPHVATLRLAI